MILKLEVFPPGSIWFLSQFDSLYEYFMLGRTAGWLEDFENPVGPLNDVITLLLNFTKWIN